MTATNQNVPLAHTYTLNVKTHNFDKEYLFFGPAPRILRVSW